MEADLLARLEANNTNQAFPVIPAPYNLRNCFFLFIFPCSGVLRLFNGGFRLRGDPDGLAGAN